MSGGAERLPCHLVAAANSDTRQYCDTPQQDRTLQPLTRVRVKGSQDGAW